MSEKEIKKANRVFVIAVIGSVTLGVAIADWNYWLGITLAYVGALSAVVYFKKVTTGQRVSDERMERINEKAASLTHAVTFISMGVLLVIVTGLETTGISIRASMVIGPFFAFMAVFHVICFHYYERRYG